MDKNLEDIDKYQTDTNLLKSTTQIFKPKLRGNGFKEDYIKINMDESIFTKDISRTSFLKKRSKKPQKWSDADTETFYRCLEIFGMDFSMIAEVLSYKTQRQILRKFKKERKRDSKKIDAALAHHESNFIERDSRTKSFLDAVFKLTSDSDASDNNQSDDSLEEAVIKKIKLLVETPSMDKDEPIKPLEYYLKQID